MCTMYINKLSRKIVLETYQTESEQYMCIISKNLLFFHRICGLKQTAKAMEKQE